MPRKWLRFPLQAADQARVAGPTTVLDGGPTRPDFLRLEFTVSNPDVGAPRVMPLFPGVLGFLADPQAPGVIPNPSGTFAWTQSEYDAWRTVGRLVIELHPTLVDTVAALAGMPKPIPVKAWYWPVRATREFLFDSIKGEKLQKAAVQRPTGGSVGTADPKWAQHAVAGFLNGKYRIALRKPASEADDDAAKFELPSVEMATDGTVGLWIAVAAGTGVDDGVTPVETTGVTPDDPVHVGNALQNARRTLTGMRTEMVDAQPSDQVADMALATWPTGPRYHSVSFSLAGNAEEYAYGQLPTEAVKVEQDANVVQDRRLPTTGIVSIAQQPGTAPPNVVLELSPGNLKVTETSGDRGGLPANQVRFDFATANRPARVTLQPAGPNVGSAAERNAYSGKLAGLCLALGRSAKTANATARLLGEYESTIRPTAWATGDAVFRGTRRPWSFVTRADLVAFFDGLQKLGPSGPNLPPVRPGQAMVLWLMEGRDLLRSDGLLAPGTDTVWVPVTRLSESPFTVADLREATGAEVLSVVRTQLLWIYWGLDAFTVTEFSAAEQDTTLKWGPTVAASAAAHDARLATGLQRVTNAGLRAPSAAAVNGTIELRNPRSPEFRLKPDYISTTVWLQYAEYLRRLVAYTDAAQTAPHPAMPTSAWELPAFSYVAFNARAGVVRAAEFWQRASTILRAAPPAWLKTEEDALRSWRLEPAEETRTPRGSVDRSKAARVNGLHFAALARSYGAIFPRVLYP